jgi:hypothetical protein
MLINLCDIPPCGNPSNDDLEAKSAAYERTDLLLNSTWHDRPNHESSLLHFFGCSYVPPIKVDRAGKDD